MSLSSRHNEWWTQQPLYEELCEKNKVLPILDVAANADNTKCMFWMRDSLNKDWLIKNAWGTIDDTIKIDLNKVYDVWFNPPLVGGMCKKFILKALEQWRKYRMNILGIVPAGVIARQYFKPIWEGFKHGTLIDIEPIRPRPKFLEYGKPTKWQARNDYISLFFKKL